MKFKVINSSSAGNAYLLQPTRGNGLLIECGVSIARIKQAIGFRVNNIAGCIVSHAHGDHALAIKEILKAGIFVYANEHTLTTWNVKNHHRAITLQPNKSRQVSIDFRIHTFEVNHDVPAFGFIIHHEEMGNCVFLTDTVYSNHVFPGINQFIVECNHSADIMESNNTNPFLRDRVVQSHMNLETCKQFIAANDLSKVNNIVLIHLSELNSDARRFKKEVEQYTGKTVQVAKPNLEINFDKTPF